MKKFVITAIIACAIPSSGLAAGGGAAVEILPDGTTIPSVASEHRPSTRESAVTRRIERQAREARASVASGCKTVDVYRYSNSLLGFTVYRFHHVARWCWTYPRVTSVNRSVYVSNVDPNWAYRGVISSSGWFYQWISGRANSGHYGFRQGKFENCVIKYACVGSEYPWVKVWVHGDGSYAWSTGA